MYLNVFSGVQLTISMYSLCIGLAPTNIDRIYWTKAGHLLTSISVTKPSFEIPAFTPQVCERQRWRWLKVHVCSPCYNTGLVINPPWWRHSPGLASYCVHVLSMLTRILGCTHMRALLWDMLVYMRVFPSHWHLFRYVKLRVAHAPGMLSPPARVSDPEMHHGTCVTHVPWCMPKSLTSGLLWSRWRENVPGIPGASATHSFTYLVRGPWAHIRASVWFSWYCIRSCILIKSDGIY